MSHLVAIVGLPGAGKSEAVKFFTDQNFELIYFGGLTLETLKKEGRAVTPDNEKEVRERLRREHGMAAYATLSIPKIEAMFSEGKNIVIDGLYSWEEYLVLTEKFPTLKVVAIQAPPALRYERLSKRPVRPLSAKEAKKRDHAQIENLHQAGPMVMADLTVNNIGTMAELLSSLKQLTF